MSLILVVEDEHSLRYEIVDTLRYEGFQVIAAADGQEALELAVEQIPDLIVSDIMMPNMDGYNLLVAIRENIRTAGIPFIFLTARTEYADMRKGMSIGADDYLVKPFETLDLIDAVQTRLEKEKAAKRRFEARLDDIRFSVVGVMPHEFRTPLAGIVGYVDLLLDGFHTLKEDQILTMLHAVQRSTNRLQRLIQNYLLFTELEIIGLTHDKLELIAHYQNLQPSNTALLDEVAQQKAKDMRRPNDLAIRLEPAVLRILNEDFKKVVDEILDNAFKFSKPGTQVLLEGANLGDGRYQLCVTDLGRGMTAEQITNIGAMVQYERRTYEQQGMGMGLTIVRRLVEVYEGRTSIQSMPDVGTTVCIELHVIERTEE